MRKIVILGLVAAIGAVAMIQHANADPNSDFCNTHPNVAGCENGQGAQPPGPPGPLGKMNLGPGTGHRAPPGPPPVLGGNNNPPPQQGGGQWKGQNNPPPQGGGQWNGQADNRWNQDHRWNQNGDWRRRHNDNGPDVGIYFGLNGGNPPPPPPDYGYDNGYGYGGGYYPSQCRNIALDLRDQGFNRVRPIKCSGPRFVFSAWRDGEKLVLYVSRDGRIRRIIPAY